MNPATIIAILQAAAALLPQIPAFVTGIATAVDLIKSGQAPTPDQQKSIDLALDAAHQALQNS